LLFLTFSEGYVLSYDKKNEIEIAILVAGEAKPGVPYRIILELMWTTLHLQLIFMKFLTTKGIL